MGQPTEKTMCVYRSFHILPKLEIRLQCKTLFGQVQPVSKPFNFIPSPYGSGVVCKKGLNKFINFAETISSMQLRMRATILSPFSTHIFRGR